MQIPDCLTLDINQKNDDDFTILQHDAIAKFF